MSPPEKDDTGPGVRVTARVALRLRDADTCAQAQAALLPESEGFLDLHVDGQELQIDVPAGSTGRVLSSLDDVLSCLQTALASKAAAASKTGGDEGPEES